LRNQPVGKLKLFDKVGVARMLQGDVCDYEATAGKILSWKFPPHIIIYAPGITPNDLGVAGRVAFA
jgi:hypothetical protein